MEANKLVLDALVELYHYLPSPEISNSGTRIHTSECFNLTDEVAKSLQALIDVCPAIAEFVTLTIDCDDLKLVDSSVLLNKLGCEVDEITINFPHRDGTIPAVYFYKDEYELVSSHSELLSKGGSLPPCFYLYCDQYKSTEASNDKLDKLDRLLNWFKLFQDISNVDSDNKKAIELVFIEKAGDDKLTKPIHFLTTIYPEMLDVAEVPNLGHFEELKKLNEKSDTHKKEKQKFLRVAFVEVLRELRTNGESEPEQIKVAKNIDNIRNSYYEHLELFMEDFAISEFKREIEDARFSYIEKIEAVIGNIQGKLYAIPAAFIAIGAIARSQTIESTILILAGAFIASIFTFIMVLNQKERAKYVDKSVEFVFEKYERRNGEEVEHPSIVNNIDDAKESLQTMITKKRKFITFYAFASWLPFIAALIVAFSRHLSQFCNWFLNTVLL